MGQLKRKDFGNITIVGPDMPTIEIDTIPCAHCGYLILNANHCKEAKKKSVTYLEGLFYENQGKTITYHCGNCNRQVCGRCSHECIPLERQLEIWEGTRNPTAVSVGMGGIVMPPE